MKALKKSFIVFTILLLASGALFASGSNESGSTEVDRIKSRGVLEVGVKNDVPHFGYQNINTGKYEGVEIELAYKVAEAIIGEPKVNFTPVTAATRGPLLDTEEIDMVIATFTVTDERRNSWDFSDIYYTDGVAIMVKKALGAKSYADLAGKTIGVAQSATTRVALQAAADEMGMSVSFLEFATYPELKSALDSGRIDAFCVDFAILNGYLEDTCEILPDRFSPQDYGVAVKKGNSALLDVVNTVIRDLVASGEWDSMLEANSLK